MKGKIIATITILLVLVSVVALLPAMPACSAATKTAFHGELTFYLYPDNWKRMWISNEIVHVRGWWGTWELVGDISGVGDILKKDSDISKMLWDWIGPGPPPAEYQYFNFQAWGTIGEYNMFITASIKNGEVINGVFVMRGPGTIVQGKVTAVDWWTSVATLDGWIITH